MSQFDNRNIKLIEADEKQVVLAYDGELKALYNVGVHHGYMYDVTGQSPIKGTMYFYKDESANWHFLSRNGYNQSKHMLPANWFATKYYIEGIQDKQWLDVNMDELLE